MRVSRCIKTLHVLGVAAILVGWFSIYQGDDDPEIFPAATEAYVKKACASGTTISYSHYADTDHLRVPVRAQADFLSWIADRFAGKPAPSTCK